MNESPNGTRFARDGDAPIIDRHGVDWALDTEKALILRGGTLQHGISHVDEILYQNRSVLAHRSADQSWYVTSPNGRWLLTEEVSASPPPVIGDEALHRVLHAINSGFVAVSGSLSSLSSYTADGFNAQGEAIGRATGTLNEIDAAIASLIGRARETLDLQGALELQIAALGAVTDAVHRHVHNLPDMLAVLASGIEAVQQGIDSLLPGGGEPPFDQKAATVRFVVPYALHPITRERIRMAVNIKDDVISVIPIEFDNVGGAAVRAPEGGTATVSIDNPAFTAEMGADGVTVEVMAVQPAQIGQVGVITYTDTLADGTAFTATLPEVTISLDPDAVSVHFRTDQITTKPLPAAVAPEPAPTPDPAPEPAPAPDPAPPVEEPPAP